MCNVDDLPPEMLFDYVHAVCGEVNHFHAQNCLPWHSVSFMHFPFDVTCPLGQKHPSTQTPLQSVSSLLSHVWGHDGPHCWYTMPDGQVMAVIKCVQQ